jgi:hypothetical protein
VGDERALDLGSTQPMTGDVDHVVDPAGEPIEPVLVAARSIPSKIEPGKVRKIGRHEPRVVAKHRAHLSGPGAGEAEIARSRAINQPAVVVDDDGLDAKEGPRCRPRLQRRRTRDRRDQDAAGLGLPPGVDNRAALLADMIVIP